MMVVAVAATAVIVPATPASAQGLFDFLFGSPRRAGPLPSARSYADPSQGFSGDGERRSAPSGMAGTFCVRLCDGRYFPIQRFLHQLRTQTHVLGDNVKSSGRLFGVDTVNLGAGEDGLPQLAATIHLNVFTYSGSAAAATSAATALTAPDSSTPTSAVAAGGTP